VKPGHSHTVTDLQPLNSSANFDHFSHAFVSGDQWKPRFHGPVARGSMKICMTNAAGTGFDKYLMRFYFRDFRLHNLKRLT
jgi:hypothetical protein